MYNKLGFLFKIGGNLQYAGIHANVIKCCKGRKELESVT